MLLETALTIAAAAGLWYLLSAVPEPLHGIYSLPGRLFYPKKWLIYLILKLFRMRSTQDPRLESKREGRNQDICYKPGHPVDALEYPQDLHKWDKDKALDVVCFNGMNTDGACFTMRIARRHDREAELWLSIKLPGVGCFQSPTHPHTIQYNTDGKSFSAGGLRFECIKPHGTWKLIFNGLLRRGIRDTRSATIDDDDVVHASLSLDWVAFSDPFNFDTEFDPWLTADAIARESWTAAFWTQLSQHHTHYEQWGELRGIVNIEGQQEMKIYLRACKNHSFGERQEGSVHRSIAHYGVSEDGTSFNVTAVSLPNTTTNLQCGYLNRPNSLQHAVTSTNLDLPNLGENMPPPEKYSFSFKANGKLYEVTLDTHASPVYYGGDTWNSVVFQQMCWLTVNGTKGCGIIDFFYKRPGEDCPVPPQNSVPMVREPAVVPREDEEASVLSFNNSSCRSSRLVGGKGCQLATLTQMDNAEGVGFTVPPGFCLTIAAFNRHIQQNAGSGDSLERKLNLLADCSSGKLDGDLKTVCQGTVEAFQASNLSPDLKALIEMHVLELCVGEDRLDEVSLAVRSSAAGEDGEELSGAGQMETLLGVKGLDQIYAAVKRCWSSNFAFLAVEYRRQHGQLINSPIAIVIQRMVPADAAGVLFTTDPLDSNPKYMTINANYGLGESVVSGRSTPDTITVLKSLNGEVRIVKKDIGIKDVQIVSAENGGTEELSIPTEDQTKCCISDEIILQLAAIGMQLEKSFSGSRDVEWAIVRNQVYLLQARPITTMNQESDWEIIHEFDSALSTDRSVLTRYNLVEVMPNAMTPLQTSHLSKRAVSNQMFPVKVGLRSFAKQYATVIVTFCNKAFLNLHAGLCINEDTALSADYRASLASLCGTDIPAICIESLREYHGSCSWWRRIINGVNLWKTLLSSSRELQWWAERMKTYKIQLEGRTARQLFDDVIRRGIDHSECMYSHTLVTSSSIGWKAILLNILTPRGTEHGNQQYADLALLLSKTSHDQACSTDVPAALKELAVAIKKTGASSAFLGMTQEEATEWLRADEAEVGRLFADFLKQHGHRSMFESQLHHKSWNQDPASLIPSLQAMVRAPEMPHNVVPGDDIDEAIASLGSPTTVLSRWILRRAVPRARRAAGNREWSKAVLIRIVEHLKKGYWTLARLMKEEGRIPDDGLMFFFTLPEIDQLLTTRSGKLIARAQRRRRVYAFQDGCHFPLLVTGRPHPIEKDPEADESRTNSSAALTLRGTPVSRGSVTGTARVVKTVTEAHTIVAGDILVVQTTDVGWSPYFPLIAGLVTEVGGLLSHGVVVAREYGIPCVVNIPRATVLFKTGDAITLNGTVGTVERSEQ